MLPKSNQLAPLYCSVPNNHYNLTNSSKPFCEQNYVNIYTVSKHIQVYIEPGSFNQPDIWAYQLLAHQTGSNTNFLRPIITTGAGTTKLPKPFKFPHKSKRVLWLGNQSKDLSKGANCQYQSKQPIPKYCCPKRHCCTLPICLQAQWGAHSMTQQGTALCCIGIAQAAKPLHCFCCCFYCTFCCYCCCYYCCYCCCYCYCYCYCYCWCYYCCCCFFYC